MLSFKKTLFRLLLFALLFVVFYHVSEFVFLNLEGSSYVTMHDLAKEKEVDVVALGNSEACCHFNPFIFQEATGKNSFNLSRTASIVLTHYILMQEMFQTHSPEKVIVFVDPLTLSSTTETPFVQAAVWPYLSISQRVEYAAVLAMEEKSYIDRFFPWRLYKPTSIVDFVANMRNKIDSKSYYNYAYNLLNTEGCSYLGKGFGPWNDDQATTFKEINDQSRARYDKEKEYNIHEDVQELFRKMNDLCSQNNCEMIAVNIPRLPGYVMARMTDIYDAEAKLFDEMGIPFWNFCYAKEELMPRLDVSYYHDRSHLTQSGADILTEALADVFNAYERGEDISNMFYQTTEEYIDSIDHVTGAWLTRKIKGKQTRFTAHSNQGTDVVPEYCFVKVDANGHEIVLQEYSTENVCVADLKEGETIRLYTRNASNLDQAPLAYDYK